MDKTTPKIFTDSEVSSRVIALVKDATAFLILVTPYIDLWENMKRDLELAMRRRVKTTVFLRKDGEQIGGNKGQGSIDWLVSKGATVYGVQNLHAKIYLSEKVTLVSSMNLLDSSAQDSLEFGLDLPEGPLANEIRRYVKETIEPFARPVPSKEPIRVADAKPVSLFVTPKGGHVGHCIRCGRPVALNPDRPLCDDCYDSWSQWENEDYEEEFCHVCGREAETSYARPLCTACFRRLA